MAATAAAAYGPDVSTAGTADTSITWAIPAEAGVIDPKDATGVTNWQLFQAVYSRLVEMDDNLEPTAGIATWTQPSDTEYVFTLDEGVTFSNGRPLTAADVVGTIDRLRDESAPSYWAVQLRAIDAVEATDDRTVTITLNQPFGALLSVLAAPSMAILPMEELADESFDPTTEMLGSGPYQVESHTRDQGWVLVANPHYHLRDGIEIDRVDVRIIPDDSSRVAALRDGSADIAIWDNANIPAQLAGIDEVTTVVQNTTDVYGFHMNSAWPDSKLHDERIRQAISLAIDREQINELALGGLGEPTGVTPVTFDDACAPDDLPSASRDLDAAQELLAEAGAEDLTFDMQILAGYGAYPAIAQVIQQNLAEVGITATIEPVEEGVFIDMYDTGEFDAFLAYYAGYGDASLVLSWYNPEIAGFTATYDAPDPEINTLIDQAQELPVGPERTAVFGEVCALVDARAGRLPLVTRPQIVAYRADVLEADIALVEGYIQPLRNLERFTLVGD